MIQTAMTIAALLCALLTIGLVSAEDSEGTTASYYQSRAFNAPILDGWENQSGEDFAQFHLAEAGATIRTAVAPNDDIVAAVGAELSDAFGIEVGQPIYQDKVNLADGTWTVLIYDSDAGVSASVMARRSGSGTAVISFVERDPATRTALLAIAQADDTVAEASPEIATAVETIAGIDMTYLAPVEITSLPSGEWVVYASDGVTAMGLVFGNDSFVALQEGAPGDLATLADAWNRTLLGFFITPDNWPYLALGLAVVFVILGTLAGSLYWRERGIQKDLALLEQLAREEA